ncbi:RHS repeat-associated core domain-containing protein [Pseudomonas syringae]
MKRVAQQPHQSRTTLCATDHPGSLLAQLQAGQPDCFAYTPFGHRPQVAGIGFNGERPDPLTGHYLLGNGYRAYNPVLMRFNSPDSLSPFGKGGINAYAYCTGDPVNRVDPSGHDGAADVASLAGMFWSAFAFYRAKAAFKDSLPKLMKLVKSKAPSAPANMKPRTTSRTVAERNLDKIDSATSIVLMASGASAFAATVSRFSGADTEVYTGLALSAVGMGVPGFAVQRHARTYRKDFLLSGKALRNPTAQSTSPQINASLIRKNSSDHVTRF